MHEPPVRNDGLQLHEHRRFQEAFWKLERAAWVLFMLVLLLALLGLTGAGGYLSRGTVSVTTGEVRFPRIARWEASDEIRVSINAGNAERRLTLGHRFFDYYEVEAVQPQPGTMHASAAGTVMVFAADPAARMNVVVHVKPLRPGLPRYSVRVDGVGADVHALTLP